MKFLAVALPALLLVSTAASGAELDASSGTANAEATTPAAPAGQTEEAADDRQICRRIETNTGSRVPFRRVCMTEREWRVFNRRD